MIVWHDIPQEGMEPNRVEINIDAVVPDVVPKEIQREWEKEDWIYEDPTKEHIATSEGPPRVSMPLTQMQKVEAAKKATGTPVLGRTIPPRSANIS